MSIIKNLFSTLTGPGLDIKEARAAYIAKWYRQPGSDEDVWEAHTALQHLEEITRRENAAATGNELEESEEWLVANASVAEAMSYISWLQEWKVRDAVAAGVPAGDLS